MIDLFSGTSAHVQVASAHSFAYFNTKNYFLYMYKNKG